MRVRRKHRKIDVTSAGASPSAELRAVQPFLDRLRAREGLGLDQVQQAVRGWLLMSDQDKATFISEASRAKTGRAPALTRRELNPAFLLGLLVPDRVRINRADPFDITPVYEQLFEAEAALHPAFLALKAFDAKANRSNARDREPLRADFEAKQRVFIELRDWRSYLSRPPELPPADPPGPSAKWVAIEATLSPLGTARGLTPSQVQATFDLWTALTQPEQHAFLLAAQALKPSLRPQPIHARDVSTALFLTLVIPEHVQIDRKNPFKISVLYTQLFEAEKALHAAYRAFQTTPAQATPNERAAAEARFRRKQQAFFELRDWKSLVGGTYQSKRLDLYGFDFEPMAGSGFFGLGGGYGGVGVITPPKDLKTGERNSRLYTRTSVRAALLQQNRYRFYKREGLRLSHDADMTTYSVSVPGVASLEFGGPFGNKVALSTPCVCPYASDGQAARFEEHEDPSLARRRFPVTGVNISVPAGPLFFANVGFNLALGGGGFSEKGARRVAAGVEKLEKRPVIRRAQAHLKERSSEEKPSKVRKP